MIEQFLHFLMWSFWFESYELKQVDFLTKVVSYDSVSNLAFFFLKTLQIYSVNSSILSIPEYHILTKHDGLSKV